MKKLITLLMINLTLFGVYAQDIIVKNDKTEIKAKIEELTETTIKYKKTEMLDGPSYNINKRDVFMIIYKNGTKEYIQSEQNQPNTNNLNQENNRSKIDEATGEAINHEKFIIIGNKVFFEGKALNRKKQIKVMGEKGSTQVKDILSSYGALLVGQNVATIVASLGVVSSLKSGEVVKPGLFIGSAVVFGSGLVMAFTGLNKYKKAMNLFNKEGNAPKVSFTPIINSNWQGNHVGVSIGF